MNVRNLAILLVCVAACKARRTAETLSSNGVDQLPLLTLKCDEANQRVPWFVVVQPETKNLSLGNFDGSSPVAYSMDRYAVQANPAKGHYKILIREGDRQLTCQTLLRIVVAEPKTTEAFHLQVSTAFATARWCEYYGKNLDAFEECLISLPMNSIVMLEGWSGTKTLVDESRNVGEILAEILARVRTERSDLTIDER